MGRAEEYCKRAEAAEEQANKEGDLKREEASWTLPPSMSGSWPSTERELVARQLGRPEVRSDWSEFKSSRLTWQRGADHRAKAEF